MLTDKDREWLEKRAVESCDTCKTPRRLCALCCRHQKYGAALRDWFSLSGLKLFVFTDEYRDAAEFEARVAATIARGEFYRPCHSVDIEKCAYPVEGNCCVCHIKYARLAVEAEMEQEGK